MSFRDQLSALIADDKKDAAGKILDALDETLTGYAEDIKKLKTDLRAKDGIKPEDFAALEKENAELKTAKGELDKSVRALTKERDELKTSLGETSAKARDYQTGVTLREALGKVGIGKLNPEDTIDAIGFIKSMLKYDDKGNALVSYKDQAGKEIEQSLGEYVEKVYPTTTHAKRFIPAAANSGTGGQHQAGGKASGNPWAKDSFNLTKQIELLRSNRPEAVRLASEAGVTIN